jgi:hypothetical protein
MTRAARSRSDENDCGAISLAPGDDRHAAPDPCSTRLDLAESVSNAREHNAEKQP